MLPAGELPALPPTSHIAQSGPKDWLAPEPPKLTPTWQAGGHFNPETLLEQKGLMILLS